MKKQGWQKTGFLSKGFLKKVEEVHNYEDLEGLGIGPIHCDISHRGGGIGFYAKDVAEALWIDEHYLPRYVGAGCNYLGGGIRGAIFAGDYSSEITGAPAIILDDIGAACCRVYEYIENEERMNDEEYEDGDTNWEAKGTNMARRAGTISAY